MQFDLELAVNPQVDLAALAANLQAIQGMSINVDITQPLLTLDLSSAQLDAFTAPPTTPGADRFTNATGRCLIVPLLSDAPGSVPKPRGSAGGGQRGYHLQAAMGLAGPEGDQLYNMILVRISLLYLYYTLNRYLSVVDRARAGSRSAHRSLA